MGAHTNVFFRLACDVEQNRQRDTRKEERNKCETVKEKTEKIRTLMVLGFLQGMGESDGRVREMERLSEVWMCEVSGGVWRPVLVPPQLLSSQPSPCPSQPVSGSLPSPPADFSLGCGEKNCPLCLSPTATA